MAIDWTNSPALTDQWAADCLPDLKERDSNLGKMDFSSDSNVPSGFIKYDEASDRLMRYNGSAWSNILADIIAHLTDTDNPHEVAAADVGNTTAQWNASQLSGVALSISSLASGNVLRYNGTNWVNATLAAAGIAAASDLTSHTGNTGNPHSVTAAQTGACAKAANLSDVNSAATAWANLGGGSVGKLNSINNAQWSGTALAVGNGGTGAGTAAAARANLVAASSGSNGDITEMTACSSITRAGDITVGPTTAASYFVVRGSAGPAWYVYGGTGTPFYPAAAGQNIGLVGNPIGTLYFNGQLDNKGTAQSWSFFSYSEVSSFNPAADWGNAQVNPLSVAIGNALNSVCKRLENIGLIN